MPLDPSVFVHEQAICDTDAVGPRTRIWAFAQVLSGARIGADCNICGQVFIEGGAEIADHVTVKNGVQVWKGVSLADEVFVGPNATFTNDPHPRSTHRTPEAEWRSTRLKRGATVGANATIVCGVTLGEWSFVAAGAVVVTDVAPHALVAGCPARRIGWACICGEKLSDSLTCRCGRSYERHGEREGIVLQR